MSMESYETMLGKFNLYRDIEISEKQIEAGQVKDAKAALVSQKSSNVHPYPLSPELGTENGSLPFACDALMQKQGHEEETGQANKGKYGAIHRRYDQSRSFMTMPQSTLIQTDCFFIESIQNASLR